MTTRTNRIDALLQDARELQADALEMLAQGRIRNAAEKAWGATFMAVVHRCIGDVDPMPRVDRRHAPRPQQTSGRRLSRFLPPGHPAADAELGEDEAGVSALQPSLRLRLLMAVSGSSRRVGP